MSSGPFCILNGELIPRDEAKISPENRGQMYGDGCFDTMKVIGSRTYGVREHYDRLKEGMAFLGVRLSFTEMEFRGSIRELLRKNDLTETEVIVRTQCWRNGSRGYGSQVESHSWYMTVSPLNLSAGGLHLITVDIPRIPDAALPSRYKWSNGINYILAAREAQNKGGDDALMLTTGGMLSESSKANIFWISGGSVYTPSEDCDILSGITRNAVIQILREHGHDLFEGAYPPEELRKAEAVFCTNSLVGVRQVETIDGTRCSEPNELLHWIGRTFKEMQTLEEI